MRGRVKTDQDLNRYAHLLVREERRLTRLVNNLLAYSRVTDVTEVYSFEALEPAALIAEATQGFRRQLTDGDVRLDVDVAPDVPAVRADRTAVVLALDNLIDNAIRYSGAANNGVRARLGRSEPRTLRRHRSRERAYQPTICRRSGDGSSAEARRGAPATVLGLAIVNRIAADHGGALEITSEVGRGTTATLIIPIAATA